MSISPPPDPATPQPLGPGQWALDRIDQRDGADLDGRYLPATQGGGEGVTVYSLDSGVVVQHSEFLHLGENEGGGGGGGGSRASIGCVVWWVWWVVGWCGCSEHDIHMYMMIGKELFIRHDHHHHHQIA